MVQFRLGNGIWKKKKSMKAFREKEKSSGHGFGLLKELPTMLQGEAHSGM